MFEYLALIVDLIIDLKLACFLFLFILRNPEQVNRIMANTFITFIIHNLSHAMHLQCAIADTYTYIASTACTIPGRERTRNKHIICEFKYIFIFLNE